MNSNKKGFLRSWENYVNCQHFFRSTGQLSESGIYIPIKAKKKLFVLFFHRRLEFEDVFVLHKCLTLPILFQDTSLRQRGPSTYCGEGIVGGIDNLSKFRCSVPSSGLRFASYYTNS